MASSNEEIVKRFFEAIQKLKSDKIIRGKKTFTDKYGINRWNFNTLEKEPKRAIFQPEWLSFLVSDYGVSAGWLLTGEGGFYDGKENQTSCKEKKGTKIEQKK